MRTIIGIVVALASICFGVWLSIWVMLVGGITQAIDCWGVDTSATVWGIVRAVFFEMGFLVSYIGVFIGVLIWSDK